MTRQIKFRAFEPDAKEMVYFDNIKASKDPYIAAHLCALMANKHPKGIGLLMQYTGLKDREGKEIYENDIVSTHDGLFIVVWEDGGTKLMQNGEIYPYYFGKYNMRVLGNVMENPELLEE